MSFIANHLILYHLHFAKLTLIYKIYQIINHETF